MVLQKLRMITPHSLTCENLCRYLATSNTLTAVCLTFTLDSSRWKDYDNSRILVDEILDKNVYEALPDQTTMTRYAFPFIRKVCFPTVSTVTLRKKPDLLNNHRETKPDLPFALGN